MFGALACGGETTTPPPAKTAISFETTTLPEGTQGEAYSAEIFAKGGSGEEYRWSVVGSLPAGLFMSSRGQILDDGARVMTTILGTPGVNGDHTFSVRLTDSDGDSKDQAFTIKLAPPPPALSISTATLPNGGTETAYEAQLEAANGEQPYRWTLVGGGLPPGIALAESGQLSGTPSAAGAFDFKVRVTDAANQIASADLTITVQDESLPLGLDTTDLPDGVVGLAYQADVVASNGKLPYSWALFGDVPPGLTLSTEGNPASLSGTPTTNGSYTFQIEVTDAGGARVRRTFFVEISRAPPPVRITTLGLLPGGEVGSAYSVEIVGVNGSGQGYTWQITEGALPAGLTLAPAGTPATTISGTPTESGDFAFTIQIMDDANRSFEADFTMTIIPQIFPVQITTTATTPGGRLQFPLVRVGESFEEQITATQGFGRYHWVISQGTLPAGLELEVSGTPSTRIAGFAGERGTFDFSVTVYDDNNVTDTKDFRIFVAGPEFPVAMVTTSVSDALACNAYKVDVVAERGSNVDYQWAITAGSLPPGLSLSPVGTPTTSITGTVLEGATGTYNFTVTVTDSAGDSDSQAFSMTVGDDGSGDRYMVMVGDMFIDNKYDIAVTNVCQAVPTQATIVSPAPDFGDADTGTTDFMLSPDGTKVAFIGDFRVVGFDEVWITDLTAATPTPVIVSPLAASDTVFDAFDLKWAPDSDHLAFLGDFTVDGINEVYVVDTSGAIVANSAIAVAPALPSYADVDSQDYSFSPDGRYLAYAVDTNAAGVYDLWVYDVDSGVAGSARQVNGPLPSTSADVNYPVAWSPDSTKILYNCDCAIGGVDEIWLADITGPTITPQVVSHPYTVGNARWTSSEIAPMYFGFSTDGTRAYYYGDGGDTALGDALYTVDLTNATARGVPVFAPPPSNAQDTIYVRPLTGARVALMGDLEASSVNELYVFDLAGPVPQDVTQAKVSGVMQPNGDILSYTDFEVSPDRRYVAFTADRDIEGLDAAYLVDVSGPTPLPAVIISPPDNTDVNLDVFNMYWAGASNWIALYGDLRMDAVNEVWGVDVSAGPPYTPVMLNPPLGSTEDINSPIVWRADGGGIIYEADEGAASVDEAWWVDVRNPGVSVRLTNVPTNGDVLYIKRQGE
ncbi:MAG: putative Ig domain-containing protein [Deltaproteobacteria bacterium]|nr:putative Ig domain-containing protein [Deltaproteobacteria bacterium]